MLLRFQQKERRFLFTWPYSILLFLLFSFIGFLYEEALFFVYGLPLEKRGFLYGPWLPIYGFGGLCVSYLTCRYVPSKKLYTPLAVFCINGIFPTLLEFIVGFFLRSINISLWDYSDRFGNLLGIIAPWPTIRFALGGLFIYYLLLPLFERLLKRSQPVFLHRLGIFFGVIFIADFLLTLFIRYLI